MKLEGGERERKAKAKAKRFIKEIAIADFISVNKALRIEMKSTNEKKTAVRILKEISRLKPRFCGFSLKSRHKESQPKGRQKKS